MISGGGSTMLNLARSQSRAGSAQARGYAVALVIASRPCAGVERARELGLPVVVMPGVIPARELDAALAEHRIELVALAGYLQLLELPRIPAWQHRVLNIHPSLLPSFGGPGMYGARVHRAVIGAGCKVSGCTVHFADAQFDTGPIVLQRACEVLDTDTPETLAARVQAEEAAAYPVALSLLAAGRLRVEGRRVVVTGSSGGGT